MKQCVDGFVLPVQKKKLRAYRKMAELGGKIWIKHGALEYVEAVGDDLKSASKWGCLQFPKMAKIKPNEAVVFAFITYKSKAHRNLVNRKVMKDPLMNDPKQKDKPMPFDMKRMAVGGFKTIVNRRR